MSNFILRDLPDMSGDYEKDLCELYSWCQELYQNLWLSEFLAIQQKKLKGGEET